MSTPRPTGTTESSATGETADATPAPHSRRPLVGGPGYDLASADGLSTLRLHAGIAMIATVLCLFVTGIFVYLGTITPAIIFAVIAVGCVAILVGAKARIRRGEQADRSDR